jgi:hypothetical protein
MQHRAIETRYKGYRFRSRLEARWAVFFDALGLRWEYEPEGFELPSGRYLPDFYLPDHRVWVEVKAAAPHSAELSKARDLMEARREPVFVTCGLPDAEGVLFYSYTQLGGEFNSCDMPAPFDLSESAMLEFVSYGGRPEIYSHDHSRRVLIGETDAISRRVSTKLSRALDAARGARFEFGESGARA